MFAPVKVLGQYKLLKDLTDYLQTFHDLNINVKIKFPMHSLSLCTPLCVPFQTFLGCMSRSSGEVTVGRSCTYTNSWSLEGVIPKHNPKVMDPY